MATVGEDIQPYLYRLERLGIGAGLLKQIAGQFTAQAFITTDLDDNQITAFHPGAMNHSHENQVDAKLGAGLAIVGPDGKEGMLQHSRQCAAHRIPFLFDPGPGPADVLGRGTARDGAAGRLPGGERLRRQAAGGKDRAQPRGPGRRAEGAHRHPGRAGLGDIRRAASGSKFPSSAPRPSSTRPAAATPTAPACSTASRSGWDWESTGRLGSLMGAIKIAQRGPQNHKPSRDEIIARYKKAFGSFAVLGDRLPDLRRVLFEFLARRVLHRPDEFHAVAGVARQQVHVVVEHRLPGRLAVRLVDRQAFRLRTLFSGHLKS